MRPGSTQVRWLGATNPRLVDGLLAVSLAGASCLVGSQYHPAEWLPFDALAYVLTCLVCLPLAVRRRYPMVALVLSCAAFATYLWAGYQPSTNFWGPIIGLISVTAHRPRNPALAGAGLTAAVIFYSGVCGNLSLTISIVQALLVPGAAAVFGTGSRRLAQRNAQLAALTAQLRAEQQHRARRAVVEERVRIARELHDVIAHHMSVISVQAGLARYVLGSDPATSRAALETIADTTREALAEMRRMLALLRIEPGELEAGDVGAGDIGAGDIEASNLGAGNLANHAHHPAPGLDRLHTLTERIRAAGLPVTVVITGERRPLPPGVDLCAYRVIQEGLTNVLNHAGPARATVELEYRRDALTVRVTDDGRLPPPVPVQGGRIGHGLTGMRERARLYGGTLTAGRRPEGGFEVMLTLPAAAVSGTSQPGSEAGSGDPTGGDDPVDGGGTNGG